MHCRVPVHRDSSGASWQSAFILHTRSSILPDLTVDGTMCTGGAVCIIFMLNGHSVGVSLFAAFIAGMIAGLVTGIFHTAMGIPAILAGILTQLGLYSINLRIMGGKANQAISVDKYDLLVSLRYVKGVAFYKNTIFVTALIIVILIGVLYWFFGTEIGCSIRATGSNQNMSRAQGINTDFTKILGLMISNGIVALCERLICSVSGLCRCQCRPWCHRDRSCSRYHRGGRFRKDQPELRFQAVLRCLRRDYLLSGTSGRTLDGIKFQRFKTPVSSCRCGIPCDPVHERQIFL